jgi:O-antigen ligase
MISRTGEKLIFGLVLICGPAVGLIIAPTYSNDPINIPKFFLLTLFAMTILGTALSQVRNFTHGLNKWFLVLATAFIIQMFLVLLFSSAPFNQQFYGMNGRNTGALAYFALICIAIGASLIAKTSYVEKVVYALLGTGLLTVGYGFLQTTGNDPVKWNNPYNSMLGFLGNPNFSSSFLGITSVAAVALGLKVNARIYLRISSVIYILLALYLIIKSQSQQGVLVFAAGTAIVLYLFIRSHSVLSKPIFRFAYLGFGSIAGLIVIMGTLNQGPLGDILYKVSVRQRGFYWRAAWEMMTANPIFGVGIDSFGDWYFPLRSANAAFYTPVTQSNSAHSIFLDLGSGGGFPLYLINISLVVLTFIVGVKYLIRNKEFNWAFAAIFGAWIAYEAQSVISINQLGVGVWGWTLMGLIVGMEFNSRSKPAESPTNTQNRGRIVRKSKEKSFISSPQALGAVIGLAFGLMIALPNFSADRNYRLATATADAQTLVDASLAHPEDLVRTLSSANALAASNINDRALALARHIVEESPNYHAAWQLIFRLEPMGSPAKLEAMTKLNELNPRVTPLKE